MKDDFPTFDWIGGSADVPDFDHNFSIDGRAQFDIHDDGDGSPTHADVPRRLLKRLGLKRGYDSSPEYPDGHPMGTMRCPVVEVDGKQQVFLGTDEFGIPFYAGIE